MTTSMLEHQKLVLMNLSENEDSFQKELEKSKLWLTENEWQKLYIWLRQMFWTKHQEIIRMAFCLNVV